MKITRILFAAVPTAFLAASAVAVALWNKRRSKSSDRRATERTTQRDVGDGAGDAAQQEVAEVAEAMAEEGGAVVVTEVEPTADGGAVVTETLLVPREA